MAQPRQQSLASFFTKADNRGEKRPSGRPSLSGSKCPRRTIEGSTFGLCPLCQSSFPLHQLETHAATCDGPTAKDSCTSKSVATKNPSVDNPYTTKKQISSTDWLKQVVEPIPGLYVYEEFITEDQEKQILAELDGNSHECEQEHLPWKQANFNGTHLGKRWGVHCNLRDRTVGAAENPLPHFVQELLIPKLKQLKPTAYFKPNEANAIDYRRQSGHYLAAHVDDRQLSKEPIANLSLAGDCFMTFRNVAAHRNTAVSVQRVFLPRRCLQVLTGKARYDFSHGIEHKDLLSDRRVSVTIRESPLTDPKERPATLQHPWWKVSTVPRRISLDNQIQPTDEPIPGLFVFDEFITEEEETAIMNELDGAASDQPWNIRRHTGSARDKSWGIDSDLWTREVRPPKYPLPKFVRNILIPKLKCVGALQGININHANSIEYQRKQGHTLSPHCDDRAKYKEPIANLSLAGSCYMTFRNVALNRNVATKERKVLLRPRCLQVLTGKARYEFSHGIENDDLLSDRRVSVTMRETILPVGFRELH